VIGPDASLAKPLFSCSVTVPLINLPFLPGDHNSSDNVSNIASGEMNVPNNECWLIHKPGKRASLTKEFATGL
jgi:hypothetical protein